MTQTTNAARAVLAGRQPSPRHRQPAYKGSVFRVSGSHAGHRGRRFFCTRSSGSTAACMHYRAARTARPWSQHMAISAELVKKLRDATGAGMMECKAALTEANGDLEAATTLLRKRGLATAQKKAGRSTSEGLVGHYIHMGGKIGVLVEVNCESDFVARTDKFQELTKEIAMHVAAANPTYVRREDVPADIVAREKDI